MTRGRKPVPTALKLINGNPGGRPLNKDEPQPVGDLFAPPAHLTESQRDAWRYAIDHAPKGLLRKLDRGLLEVWVTAEDLHRQATQEINDHGMFETTGGSEETKTSKDGTVTTTVKKGVRIQSPALQVKNRQAEIMMRIASELGFTPTSRSRITLGGGEASKTSNKFSNNAARRA
jgi:P27 family predicted phage terminase small subunit